MRIHAMPKLTKHNIFGYFATVFSSFPSFSFFSRLFREMSAFWLIYFPFKQSNRRGRKSRRNRFEHWTKCVYVGWGVFSVSVSLKYVCFSHSELTFQTFYSKIITRLFCHDFFPFLRFTVVEYAVPSLFSSFKFFSLLIYFACVFFLFIFFFIIFNIDHFFPFVYFDDVKNWMFTHAEHNNEFISHIFKTKEKKWMKKVSQRNHEKPKKMELECFLPRMCTKISSDRLIGFFNSIGIASLHFSGTEKKKHRRKSEAVHVENGYKLTRLQFISYFPVISTFRYTKSTAIALDMHTISDIFSIKIKEVEEKSKPQIPNECEMRTTRSVKLKLNRNKTTRKSNTRKKKWIEVSKNVIKSDKWMQNTSMRPRSTCSHERAQTQDDTKEKTCTREIERKCTSTQHWSVDFVCDIVQFVASIATEQWQNVNWFGTSVNGWMITRTKCQTFNMFLL